MTEASSIVFQFFSTACKCEKGKVLRMSEYVLQWRESIPIYFTDHSEVITGQCKKMFTGICTSKHTQNLLFA